MSVSISSPCGNDGQSIFSPDLYGLYSNVDGFVKSPSAALPCILRRCGVLPSTPHSSGFARRVPRNAGELFTLPSTRMAFYEIIKILASVFPGKPSLLHEALGF
ncbi:MAG: hypothetical protein NTY64_13535 [Deltaproteobacteria bacterium]|nr:hypothetical protein [Deltaproteobacteria bacterium]